MPTTPLMGSALSSLDTMIAEESDLNIKSNIAVNNKDGNKDGNKDNNIEILLTQLFINLERNYAKVKIQECIQEFITLIDNLSDYKKSEYCSYLIILLFHTRDIQNGKGERKVARDLFLCLYNYFPRTLELLVSKLPDYGYWRDLSEIILDINTDLQKYGDLKTVILNTIVEQLKIDWDNYELWENDKLIAISQGKEFNRVLSISMLAKWIPKENGHYDKRTKVAKDLAKLLYPNEFKVKFNIAMSKYRNIVVKLNAAINTTEILMCDKKFSQIQFKLVPGKCLNKYKCAFLNILPNTLPIEQVRYIDNQDRIDCRNNLINYNSGQKLTKHVKITDKLFINEIVEKLMPQNISKLNNEEIELMKLYWKNIHNEFKNLVDSNKSNLSKGVILSDMSGSMIGKPIAVSIASAIFISSFLKEPFADRFISFDTNPTWNIINNNDNLVDKINMIMKTSWRGFTDLEKSYNLILDKAILNKLEPNDIPKWFLIVTDMPFSKAMRNEEWSNIYEHIEQRFIQIGLNTIGKPYTPPEMLYWNVRGDNNRLPTYSKHQNLLLITGFNVSIFKEILKTQNLSNITPWMNIKCILDTERYEPIMQVIRSASETPYFRHYAIAADTEVLNDTSSPITSSKSKNNSNKGGFLNYLSSYF
jgi:hypothetical protein